MSLTPSPAPCAITAHTPLGRRTSASRKLARNLPGPFAVLETPEGEVGERLASIGCQAFRFTAKGHAVERLARGYFADRYYFVPLTVWAFNESAAQAEAERQINTICPAASWVVLPA